LPTVSLTENLAVPATGQVAFVPVRHNNKIWAVCMEGDGTIAIVNLTDKTVAGITETQDPDYWSGVWESRLIDWKQITGSTVTMRCVHIRTNTVVIDRVEADLSALEATRTEESTLDFTWLTDPAPITHGVVIPPRLHIAPEGGSSPIVHYIDLETGSDVSWDTGFGSYFARASHKYVVKSDDIYMLFGKHLAGDVHRYLKLFSQQLVELESSGGGSPRPQIGGVSWFYNDLLFPATSGGVEGADNDIFIYDDEFTKLGTIDLAGLTGWSVNDAFYGFNIYAKKTGGGYYMLLSIVNNVESLYRLYHVELNSTFGVVASTLLFEKNWGFASGNMNPDYTDWCNVPVIDVNAKKIYVFGSHPSGETARGFIAEIDISDVWGNIAELNKAMWHLGAVAKIPTVLTLQVTPL